MTLSGRLVGMVLAAGSLAAHPAPLLAQWALDGAPVCVDRDSIQRVPAIAADGVGGAIVAWADLRKGSDFDIFAQRITASGRVAPGWPRNGVPVTRAVGHQFNPVLISDGAGGAIIAWWGSGAIRAQRITGAGKVAEGWPADGLPLSDSPDDGFVPAIVSDGQGGATVLWVVYRYVPDAAILAQRVTGAGTLAPGWPGSGVLLARVTSQPGLDSRPHACSDGTGGALVTWLDGRAEVRGDVYAQHVTGGGAIADGWSTDGVGIAVAPDPINRFSTPVIAPDGNGGAIISWYDSRDAFPPVFRAGVRALRIKSAGSLADGWPPEGIQVGGSQGSEGYPTVAADGQSGAFIAWSDHYGRSPEGIYVQHLNGEGRVAPSWPSAGLALSIQSMPQEYPVIVSDGGGGGIVTWVDYRNGAVAPLTNPDVYAQRFTADGRIASGWPANGVALCRAIREQFELAICADGSRGAIVAWEDRRPGTTGDIYAARVLERGWVPPAVPIEIKPGGPMHTLKLKSEGRVPIAVLGTQSFDASTVRVSTVTAAGAPVSSKHGEEPGASMKDVNHDGLPDLLMRFDVEAMNLSPSDSLVTLKGETLDGLPIEGWSPVRIASHALRNGEVVGRDRAGDVLPVGESRFALVRAWPSPSFGQFAVSFSLPDARPAALELLDVSGRRMLVRDVGTLGPGLHVVDLSPGSKLVPGVYLVKLRQGGQAQSAKVIIL